MKVLVVGGGGREHALVWKLRHENPTLAIFAAPGNPGIAELAQCVPITVGDIDGLVAFADREQIDLTVIGPEAPLAAGISDRFRAARLAVFGPTQAAARIETSKNFAKRLMRRAHVPTASAAVCSTLAEATAAIERLGAPVVIKASGLAAGKGVIVCQTPAEARQAVSLMLESHAFGAAGDTVLVEEFMTGEEVSLFGITDGNRVVPLVPAQDHKRLLSGDVGPNTGGMGAYAPVIASQGGISATGGFIGEVMERVFLPTLRALREERALFTGLLYAGLMLTDDGPKVVEFNCRFGDPETQAILPVLDVAPSFLDLMLAVGRREPLPDAVARVHGYAVTTVLAASGYPDRPQIGDPIVLPPTAEGILVFHSGTARTADDNLVTAGGRVLSVTGVAPSFDEARERSVRYAEAVAFRGKQFRSDIGWRELARRAGAA